MLLNAGSLASRPGGHGGIDSFVRAFKSIRHFGGGPCLFNDPYISTKRSLIYSRVFKLPDSVVIGVVTCLLSGGGEFQGGDRGRCVLHCPFIGSLFPLFCWVGPYDGLPFHPQRGWYPLGMFRASLVISRWSYPLGWSTKGGCWFPSVHFSALVVALQSPKART